MLSDSDLMRVQEAAAQMPGGIVLLLHSTASPDLFEQNLSNVARQIAGVSLRVIDLEETSEHVLPGKPSVTIAWNDHRAVHYLAAPEGPELAPFLDAMRWISGAQAPPTSHLSASLDRLGTPADVLVLVAAACPHCPKVVQRALALAAGRPMISVTIVDAVQFPDLAKKYKVTSTPTVVINETATFVGDVTAEQMVKHLFPPSGIESYTDVLASMIESGRAEDAAAVMVKNNVPRAILPIFGSAEFSKRMGAMVTMEEALELLPDSLDSIVPPLTELLFHEEVGIRGDTAEILARIGHAAAIPALRRAAEEDDNPHVLEAVKEALEFLESPSQSR